MFISTTDRSYLRMLLELVFLAVAIFAIGSLFTNSQERRPRQSAIHGNTTSSMEEPLLREYNGVSLGMTAAETRRRLGEPTDKSDEQDFYAISDGESAQVFYDSSRKVKAISVHYTGKANVPTPKSLFGTELEPSDDGSVYKLVRYERAGYWVSYSRTAGDSPVISVSMQKLP
jgi:hypothetical protein